MPFLFSPALQDKERCCALWIWEDLLEDYVYKRVNQVSEYYKNIVALAKSDGEGKDLLVAEAREELAAFKKCYLSRLVLFCFISFALGWSLPKMFL